MKLYPNIQTAIAASREFLLNTGQTVKGIKWQGTTAPAPMFEAMDLSIKFPMPRDIKTLTDLCPPSTPWAEKHFQERIGGIPLNPPPSHEYWPFGKDNNKAFTGEDAKFDHTYPERFWPKNANKPLDEIEYEGKMLEVYNPIKNGINRGIRFEYGDLSDVIQQLKDDPYTRQAYLPIWFPEDTGAKGGRGRVPCTIGYHFMVRNGFLHLTYWMRSCDYKRHFIDDLYLAVRLAQHVREQIKNTGSGLMELQMGLLKFHAVSFHIFDFEKNKI